METWGCEWAANYLDQVVSIQGGVHCHLPGHVHGDDVPHSPHLVDDSVGVGHGLSRSCAHLWLAEHPVDLSLDYFWEIGGGCIILIFHNFP